MEAGNKSLKINVPMATEQDLPINVVMSKRNGDLTAGMEDTSLAALANPRRVRTDVTPLVATPFPVSKPPPSAPQFPPQQTTQAKADEDDWGDDDEEEGEFEEFGEEQSIDNDMIHNAERIKSEKMDVLNKLYRLGQKGVDVPAHLSMKCSLEELQTEFGKLEHDYKVRNSIKLQRRMLMGLVTGEPFHFKMYLVFNLCKLCYHV